MKWVESSELDRVKSDIHAKLTSEIEEINSKLSDITASNKCTSGENAARDQVNVSLNIVIRGLPRKYIEQSKQAYKRWLKDHGRRVRKGWEEEELSGE